METAGFFDVVGEPVYYTAVYKVLPGYETHWVPTIMGDRTVYRAFHNINGEWVRCEFLGFFP